MFSKRASEPLYLEKVGIGEYFQLGAFESLSIGEYV